MSAVKIPYPPYRLFEPDYHPQKPIIVGVDDRLESPETVTLRYEEAARVASGGATAGTSPLHFPEMATYGKTSGAAGPGVYDTPRYQSNGYDQYTAQTFPAQSVEKFAQLNQQAFASNNAAVAPYMGPNVSVVSCQPSSGVAGNKVFLKISATYDLFTISSPIPYVNILFGSEKRAAQDFVRESQDGPGYNYACNCEVPQAMVTGCSGSNVPLTLLIETPNGEEISRASAGSFQYLDGSADGITRTAQLPKNNETTTTPASHNDQASPSPKLDGTPVSGEAVTNNYDYPAQTSQYSQQQYQPPSTDMITTYRTTNFVEPPGYRRRPGPAWSFGGPLGSSGRSPGLDHALAGRSPLTPLSMPSASANGAPRLVRTSTMTSGSGYHAPFYPTKANLKLGGKLESMCENWTQEEWGERRRLVTFQKRQSGPTIHANFRGVSLSERNPQSTTVSCIWWQEKQQCYVTSVDTIYLLEQLVAAPNKFSVEEKNRIRRNLEGFHPLTVSKAKAESEDFFKLIMAFPNPKPRNIEKDVKVFPWKTLESALKKIIGKYSANPGSLLQPPSSMSIPQQPQLPGPATYATLPTPPGQALGSQHTEPHSAYSLHSNHNDSIPSPRSLSGSQGAWGPYSSAPSYSSATSRPLSPHARTHSPSQPPLRLTTAPLPSVTSYDTRTVTTGGYSAGSGLHTPVSHSAHSMATPPRWDPTTASYGESYSSLTSHQGNTSQPVYSASYHDGASRA